MYFLYLPLPQQSKYPCARMKDVNHWQLWTAWSASSICGKGKESLTTIRVYFQVINTKLNFISLLSHSEAYGSLIV